MKIDYTISEGNDLDAAIGTLTLSCEAGVKGQPLIQNLLVESTCQRQGIATRLIKRAEQKAKEEAQERIQAITHPDNEAVNALFKKLGYKKMHIWVRSVGRL